MGCSHEANEHDHANCDHSKAAERGIEYSVYQYIDTAKVTCLNEKRDGDGAQVFKSYDDRQDKTKFVESDADETLLFYIPFTGHIKLKSIIVIGGPDGQHPKSVKLFPNKAGLDFDDVEDMEAAQTLDLSIDYKGDIEYPVNVCKFHNLFCLTLYFPDNFGDEETKISYIGLAGEFDKVKRDTVITVYEASANPADHKTKNQYENSHQIS